MKKKKKKKKKIHKAFLLLNYIYYNIVKMNAI
jgi:hypothetical protein